MGRHLVRARSRGKYVGQEKTAPGSDVEVPVVTAFEKSEELAPPYRINLRGVVRDVSDPQPSANGRVMRNFKLVDGNGS